MKVITKQSKFEPIIITLETEREVAFLWHLLNCGEGKTFLDYCKGWKMKYNGTLNHDMWHELDEVYSPHKDY